MVRMDELDLRFASYRLRGPGSRESALERSLQRDGQRAPVLVSDGVEPGRLVLLDGFRRVDLLRQGGHGQVLALVISADVPASLASMLAANAGQRGVSDLEEAWVLRALHEEHGLDQSEIGVLVGRDKSWVCRRLSLVTHLDRQVQDDIRVGLVSPTIARELALLPRGNQSRACASMVRHRLTSRQARELVKVLRSAPHEEFESILANPLDHLPQRVAPPSFPGDPRLSDAANRVRSQLLLMHGAANRVRETLLNRPPGLFSRRDADLLSQLAPPILAIVREALDRVEEVIGILPGATA